MALDGKLLDDLARIASSAFGTVAGMREEARAQFRQQAERVLARLDVVTREEFEVVRAMAAASRERQEALEARLTALESRSEGPAQPAEAKAAVPRTGRPRRKPQGRTDVPGGS